MPPFDILSNVYCNIDRSTDMDIINFTSPFTGAEIKCVELDDRTLLIDAPIGPRSLYTLQYDAEHDCYLLPAEILAKIDTVSATQAAKMLDTGKMQVSRMCESGQLKSVKTLGRLVIEKSSVVERQEHDRDNRELDTNYPQ